MQWEVAWPLQTGPVWLWVFSYRGSYSWSARQAFRVAVEDYRRRYNGERPHSSLGYRAPDEFAQNLTVQHADTRQTSHPKWSSFRGPLRGKPRAVARAMPRWWWFINWPWKRWKNGSAYMGVSCWKKWSKAANSSIGNWKKQPDFCGYAQASSTTFDHISPD